MPMALKAIIAEAEHTKLPEAVQKEYTKRDDGTFMLDVEVTQGFGLENVDGLKKALEAERGTARKLTATLKSFEGLDPAAARAAVAKVVEMEKWDPEKEVAEKIKAREEQLVKKHQDELTAVKGKADSYFNQMKQDKVTAAITAAVTEHKGSVDLLLPIIERHVKLREADNGTLVVEVVDDKGQPRVGDGQGNPMTIPQFVAELRSTDRFARAFDGTGSTGSGAGGGSAGGGGGPGPKGRTTKTITSKEIGSNLEAVASGDMSVAD